MASLVVAGVKFGFEVPGLGLGFEVPPSLVQHQKAPGAGLRLCSICCVLRFQAVAGLGFGVA
jgi:hypothetical protein